MTTEPRSRAIRSAIRSSTSSTGTSVKSKYKRWHLITRKGTMPLTVTTARGAPLGRRRDIMLFHREQQVSQLRNLHMPRWLHAIVLAL